MARSDRPTPDQLETWRLFLVAHRDLVDHLDRALRDAHDLPIEWYDVLVQLAESGGRRRMSDLAAAVLITAPNCTRLVDRMSAAGLVDRVADPDDARARLAVLTDQGRKRLLAAAPSHLEAIQQHFAQHLPQPAETDATAGGITTEPVAGFLRSVVMSLREDPPD